ncbi:hypothetical protein HBO08_02690 [Pseudomonas rhodesiae]|uniref:hypothetical protein n=1 Tax=Pseudomonas rhodesiae TaxID=76760 RepID=UPI001473C96E|nr:hypothetical protein [Pseudomonas rhodesiae]NMZ15926.1 hypothetical protein [Pseudomonas rhodesiae]
MQWVLGLWEIGTFDEHHGICGSVGQAKANSALSGNKSHTECLVRCKARITKSMELGVPKHQGAIENMPEGDAILVENGG